MCFGDSDHKGGLGPGTDVCEHMLGVHTGARQAVGAKGPRGLGHRGHGSKPSEALFLPSSSTYAKSRSQTLHPHFCQSTGQDLKQQRTLGGKRAWVPLGKLLSSICKQ